MYWQFRTLWGRILIDILAGENFAIGVFLWDTNSNMNQLVPFADLARAK